MTQNTNDTQSFRILHIEDNAVDAKLIESTLAQTDLFFTELILQPTLEDGLIYLNNDRPDLILLDLNLPDTSGMTTLERIHENHPNVPVVILTDQGSPEDQLKAIQNGASDFIVKTEIDPFKLAKAILNSQKHLSMSQQLEDTTQELSMTQARIETLALHDSTTRLLNRRGLQAALTRELYRAERDQEHIMSLFLEIDDYRDILDSLGFAITDVVLSETCHILKRCLRVTDYIARVGESSFMILLPKTRLAECEVVAEKIRTVISTTPITFHAGKEIHITASVGLLSASEEHPTVEELLSKAHAGLTRSRKSGINRVFHCPGMGALLEGEESTNDLIDALCKRHNFHVFKQPIFNIQIDEIVGYELLSRFSVPSLEMPDDFFGFCQENNLLTLVDHNCLRACVEMSSSFSAETHRHINLFPSTLMNTPIEHILSTFAPEVPKESYCLEISEQQIVGHPSYLLENINKVKEAGIQISIDDVGFGRSCLENLILLEPDSIKIDKSCVMGIAQMKSRSEPLRRLLKVAKTLNLEVVAEGIETEEDLMLLKQMGVKYGQGYLLGRPEPA